MSNNKRLHLLMMILLAALTALPISAQIPPSESISGIRGIVNEATADAAKRKEKLLKEEAKRLRRQEKEKEKQLRKQPAHADIDANQDAVKAALLRRFIPHGYGIASETPSQLIVWRWHGGILAHLFLGNAYSEDPRQFISFIFVPKDKSTSVIVYMEISRRMPFGNIDSMNMTLHKKWKKEMQSILDSVKFELEPSRRL